MDVVRLDQATYQPDILIENYDSVIWTERYTPSGEFVLTTAAIEDTMTKLPTGSLISHLETREVMVVEDHKIEENDDGIKILTTTGRTFEADTFENKTLWDGTAIPLLPGVSKWSDVLEYWLASKLVTNPYAFDRIPNVIPYNLFTQAEPDITGITTFDGLISIDSLYANFVQVLNLIGAGYTNIRPSTDETALSLVIRNGIDLEVVVVGGVVLDVNRNDILDPSYLFSIKNYRNVAYVNSPLGFGAAYPSDVVFWDHGGIHSGVPTGRNRRILTVDASDLVDSGSFSVDDAIRQRGRLELTNWNVTQIIDGEVAWNSEFQYGTGYNLGDRLIISGDYGVETALMVSEFVRTEDQSGDRGFPTLTIPPIPYTPPS